MMADEIFTMEDIKKCLFTPDLRELDIIKLVYNKADDKSKSALVVQRIENKQVFILNSFVGDEADNLYRLLMGVSE